MGNKWRNEYRRCERCKAEYRPQRQAQSYCSPDCRRAAAYGRERFKAGTTGRRRRRLEASDNVAAILGAGSFRNGDFSSSKTGSYRPINWIDKLNQTVADEIDRSYWFHERRKWPFDLMGGQRHGLKLSTSAVDPKLGQAILDTEQALIVEDKPRPKLLKGDDIVLEYHEDGYPKLPAFLDRRPLPPLAQAA
jgi:hypothetical protein